MMSSHNTRLSGSPSSLVNMDMGDPIEPIRRHSHLPGEPRPFALREYLLGIGSPVVFDNPFQVHLSE